LIADYYVNRWLERRTVHVGSFPIVLAAFGGLELYGLTGALLFMLGAIWIVALVSEVGPEEVSEALAHLSAPPAADKTIPPGPRKSSGAAAPGCRAVPSQGSRCWRWRTSRRCR